MITYVIPVTFWLNVEAKDSIPLRAQIEDELCTALRATVREFRQFRDPSRVLTDWEVGLAIPEQEELAS